MKNLFLLLALVVFSTSAFAQKKEKSIEEEVQGIEQDYAQTNR